MGDTRSLIERLDVIVRRKRAQAKEKRRISELSRQIADSLERDAGTIHEAIVALNERKPND